MSLPIDVSQMDITTYLLKLEENLMTGSARWITDFTESFRNYPIRGESFDMVVTGSTRPRGFLLSKLFAYFSLPNYSTACYVHSGDLDLRRMDELAQLILDHMRESSTDWSWLVIPQEGAHPLGLRELVEKKDTKELGIALVDISSGKVTTNPCYVGKRMADHVRCFR